MPPYEADKERAAAYHLTERELEVLCLVCGGLSGKEAGGRLGIDDATARYHLSGVRRKLDTKSTAEACAKAVSLGIIRPGSPD